jgi:putative ABC transport system permease protein
MPLSVLVRLAFKYLLSHARRYAFLSAAIALGFSVITVMTGLGTGMERNVYRASEQHYAGHLFVVGYWFNDSNRSYSSLSDDNETPVLEAIEASGIKPVKIVRRTNYFKEGTLYFGGTGVRQKNIFGVDWDAEKETLSALDFAEGGFGTDGPGADGIFLSEPVARKLQVRVNDDVQMTVNTKTGQRNLGTFVVRGIFRDESIFGYYKSYVDRRSLNRLLNVGENTWSTLGIYLPPGKIRDTAPEMLYKQLVSRVQMAPLVTDKDQMTTIMRDRWKGIRYLLVPLPIYISQVSDLLEAMNLISYFLYVMIVLIILVSISVTYKLIVNERITEIGTMRAIGFQKPEMLSLYLVEALLLYSFSMTAGFLLSVVILQVISRLSFSSIPGIELLMDKGRLTADFTAKSVILNVVLLLVITVPAVLAPLKKAVDKELRDSLSSDRY